MDYPQTVNDHVMFSLGSSLFASRCVLFLHKVGPSPLYTSISNSHEHTHLYASRHMQTQLSQSDTVARNVRIHTQAATFDLLLCSTADLVKVSKILFIQLLSLTINQCNLVHISKQISIVSFHFIY